MKRATYFGFLFLIPIVIAALMPLMGYAQGLSFTTGEKLSHQLSVCIEKADAVEIAEAYRAGGKEAAEVVWNAKEHCQNVTVAQGSVGKVAYAVRGLVVVEIVIDGKVAAYFITSAPVNKVQRNS